MKAKDAYEKMKQADTKEDLNVILNEIISSFCKDISDLIGIRHAKTESAIRSIVSEVNNKWHAVVVMAQKDDDHHFFGYTLNDDALYLIITEENPQYKKFFEKEVKRGKARVEKSEKAEAECAERVSRMYAHKVMPLNEVTKENILMETFACMAALGSYASAGIPVNSLRGLAHRIGFLEYWKNNGINYDEIPEYEKAPSAFVLSHDTRFSEGVAAKV